MAGTETKFRIGMFYPNMSGMHLASAKSRELNLDVLDPQTHIAVAGAAEQAGLDYLFLADVWGGRGPRSEELGLNDPILMSPLLATLLAGATRDIKIITTLHLTWLHPLVVARIGADLDALTGGRWGLNAVTGDGFAPALFASVSDVSGHDERYAAASEAMQIALQAWSEHGTVDFDGTYYHASGRLVGPHAVQQPHPMIVSAGASPAGCVFAGTYASMVFIPGGASPQMIKDRRRQIEQAAEQAGRDPNDIRILLHASTLIRDSQQEAEELSNELRDSVDLTGVFENMQSVMTSISTYADLYEKFTEDQLRDIGLTSGSAKLHGSPEGIADRIEQLITDTGCDGISLSFPIWQPEEIAAFGTKVAPLLQQRGIWTPAPARQWTW